MNPGREPRKRTRTMITAAVIASLTTVFFMACGCVPGAVAPGVPSVNAS